MLTNEQKISQATGYLQARKAKEALEAVKPVVDQEPGNAAARHALGLAYYMMRRYAEAHQHLGMAVLLNDRNALYHHNLGEVLRRMNRPREAVKAYERATIVMPEFLKGHLGLGNTYRDLGRTEEAVARFRLILAINPRFADAYSALATTYTQMGRAQDAIPLLRKVVALKPSSLDALLALANAVADEDPEEAIELYRRILAIQPSNAAALNNLGNILKTLGRMDEAVDVYTRAVADNPESSSAWYNLSRSRKGSGGEDEVKQLEDLLVKPGLDWEQKVNLHFALGKIYDDTGRFDKAFQHFEMGNSLDTRGEAFNPEVNATVANRLIGTFTRAFFEDRESWGSDSEQPVFIVGMPRSGTTLVEQILASHSKVFGAGELRYVGDLTADMQKEMGLGAFPDSAANLDAVTVLTLAERYLRRIHTLAGKRRPLRISDKMPGNFMHVGLIALLYPKARIINCRREPLDVCVSCFSQFFTAVMPFSRSLSSLGRYWYDYDRLMDHWRAVLPPGRLFEVDYSEMIADQEGVSRRLLDYCGLEWEDAVLDFHKTKRPVKTASTWQVRQPIYTSSVDRWRNYEPYLAPLIEAMGDRYRPPPARAIAAGEGVDAGAAEASADTAQKGKGKRAGKAAQPATADAAG